MTRISSTTVVMEAYHKLTQSPSQMEEELKKELIENAKGQTGETSSLDDLTEVVGAIKEEVQFLNKAKDTFNEVYNILEEAHTYLKSLNHDAVAGLGENLLKSKLDSYITSIKMTMANENNSNFSALLVDYINKLSNVNINDIWDTLSAHETQAKSRIRGDLDSSISTNEILSSKQITVVNPATTSLLITQTAGGSAQTIASSINADPTFGVYAVAENKVSIANLSNTGTYGFKITNTKTGGSGHSLSGISITDVNILTPIYDAINNAAGSTGIIAKINSDLNVVTLEDSSGDTMSLTNFTESSSAKTLNIFSEYNRSSRNVDLKDLTVHFEEDNQIGSNGELRGGFVEFFPHDKLSADSITVAKQTYANSILNEVSIVGDQVYVGLGLDDDGNALTSQIGYIHSTHDGEDGARLRFKFYDEDISGTQTKFVNESTLQKLADLITFNYVNMSLTDQDKDPRIEAVTADVSAYIESEGLTESPVSSTANATNTANYGLASTHNVTVTGNFQYVGNISDISRTVTIEANASSKLLAEQLNTIGSATNTSFSARNNVIISNAEALGAVSFKLASHNKTDGIIGTADITANITETGQQIRIQTGGVANTRSFTITGTGSDGSTLTETISNVAANSTETGSSYFSTVHSVLANGSLGGDGVIYVGTDSDPDGIVNAPGGGGYSEPTLLNFKINGAEATDKNVARLTYQNTTAERNLTNLKTAINAATGTTGISAADWYNNQALLLTHSTGENIVVSELSGVGLKLRGTEFNGSSATGTQRTLDASRNLELIADKRFVAITPSSEGNVTADYTITGTNFSGNAISETISAVAPGGGVQYSKQVYSTVSQITTSNVTSDVTLIGSIDTDGSSNHVASSIIADYGSDTARPLNANGTTKSEIAINGSAATSGGNKLLLASDAGEYVVITADANTVSRRVLIQGLDYTGTNRNSYINTTPGGVATGTQLYATVYRMRINGPTVGEKITITNNNSDSRDFDITGTSTTGSSTTETVSVGSGNTVTGSTYFKTVTGITVSGSSWNGTVKIGTSRDDDGIYESNTPSSTNLTPDGAYESSGTATLADGNIKIGIATNDDGMTQSQKMTGTSNWNNISENGDIDSSSGRYALTEGKFVTVNVPTEGIKGTYRVKGMNRFGINNREETINANAHNNQFTGSTAFMRINNVYVDSLSPSDIKVGTARDNGDSGTADTVFDDDAITTASGYQAAGNLNINGSATSGGTAVLNDSNLTFNVSGTNSEGNNITESLSGSATSPTVKTSNQYATVTQISVSNSPSTSAAGRLRIGTNTSTNNIATTQTPNPGSNLSLAGSASSISTNDSALTIGTIQGSSRQNLSTTATNSYYSLQSTSDILDDYEQTFTTPIPNLSSPGLKLTTNNNQEVIATGEIWLHSNKPFTVTQQDAANEKKAVTIYAAGGTNNIAYTVKGKDELGNLIEESITSSAGSTVTGSTKFATVYQVSSANATGGNVKVGTYLDDDGIATNQSRNSAGNLSINGARVSDNQAVLRNDGSTFFSMETSESEIELYDFNLSQAVAGQEFTQRYAHALTDMQAALTTIDNELLRETQTDNSGAGLLSGDGKPSYTKEEFLEMGLTTADRLKNLTSKTLLVKNIHSQRQNLGMLMSGQFYGFALMNFKGNFDLTKK